MKTLIICLLVIFTCSIAFGSKSYKDWTPDIEESKDKDNIVMRLVFTDGTNVFEGPAIYYDVDTVTPDGVDHSRLYVNRDDLSNVKLNKKVL